MALVHHSLVHHRFAFGKCFSQASIGVAEFSPVGSLSHRGRPLNQQNRLLVAIQQFRAGHHSGLRTAFWLFRLCTVRYGACHGQTSTAVSDQVRAAFHEAGDEGDVILAEALLRQMEQVIDKPLRLPTGFDRRRPETLIAS